MRRWTLLAAALGVACAGPPFSVAEETDAGSDAAGVGGHAPDAQAGSGSAGTGGRLDAFGGTGALAGAGGASGSGGLAGGAAGGAGGLGGTSAGGGGGTTGSHCCQGSDCACWYAFCANGCCTSDCECGTPTPDGLACVSE